MTETPRFDRVWNFELLVSHLFRISSFGLLAFLSAWLFVAASTSYAADAEFMFRARVDGRMLEGMPLYWTDTQMMLLGRDGAMYEFNPKLAKEGRKTAPRFYGYEMRDMKRTLYEEFGDRFDISTTQHYIVAHPRGQRDLWAQRFEDMYRSFTHYFRVRGFRPTEPKFPLMAVVFRNKEEYYDHAQSVGTPLQPGFLGHYDPTTNRVFLYDLTAGTNNNDWSRNADTIIHEATHQTAYNVGIHTRFTGCSQWVVEGLATMFEAPGVWDSRSHPSDSDRLNQGRLRDFQGHVKPRWKEGSLRQFVATDDMFRRDAAGAYATAWAFSYYLCETKPRDYCTYLERTADRKMFTAYPAQGRLADFERVFGNEWKMMEVKFFRFMEELE
jgi:hypothetical protein